MDHSTSQQWKQVWCTSLNAKSEPCVSDLPPDDIADGGFRDRAQVVDAVAVLQIMKKIATMHTFADLKEA